MEKYLLRKFVKILEEENNISGVQQYKNLLGEDVVSFWVDDIQYVITIDEIFRKSGNNE